MKSVIWIVKFSLFLDNRQLHIKPHAVSSFNQILFTSYGTTKRWSTKLSFENVIWGSSPSSSVSKKYFKSLWCVYTKIGFESDDFTLWLTRIRSASIGSERRFENLPNSKNITAVINNFLNIFNLSLKMFRVPNRPYQYG